jgi:hypothetical protein
MTVVSYGCETLSLKSREELRLKVYKKRVPKTIFEPTRDEMVGGWIQLLDEELHNLYSSPNKIRMIKPRRMRWSGHKVRMEGRGMHMRFWWESQKERHH